MTPCSGVISPCPALTFLTPMCYVHGRVPSRRTGVANTNSIMHRLFETENSIIADGNHSSHMNNSEKDDKNRFCIWTEKESKTLASYQDPKTRRAGHSTRKDSSAARARYRQSDTPPGTRDTRRPPRGSDDVFGAPRAAPVGHGVARDRSRSPSSRSPRPAHPACSAARGAR